MLQTILFLFFLSGCYQTASPLCESDAKKLILLPTNKQIIKAFQLGERHGQTRSLAQIAACSQSLPLGFRNAYLDGGGHTFPFTSDSLPQQVESIKSVFSYAEQTFFFDGLLSRIVILTNGERQQVDEAITQLQQLLPDWKPHNGLRIGLRQIPDTNFQTRIKKSQQFSSMYHPALFEELGWESGDHFRKGYKLRFSQINSEVWCAYVHGYGRGRWQHELPETEREWKEFRTRSAEVEVKCPLGFWLGIFRGMQIVYPQLEQQRRTINNIPFATIRSWMLQTAPGYKKASLWDIPLEILQNQRRQNQ